jgi:DNA-directed RNA polymerase subunit RPC12/RpoP
MLCNNCGSEDFMWPRVKRSKHWIDGKGWTIDNHIDTRIIICNECGTRYYLRSEITHVFIWDETKMKNKIVPVGQVKFTGKALSVNQCKLLDN